MFDIVGPVKIRYKGFEIRTEKLSPDCSRYWTSIQRPDPDSPSFQFTSDCPVEAELDAKRWIDDALWDISS